MILCPSDKGDETTERDLKVTGPLGDCCAQWVPSSPGVTQALAVLLCCILVPLVPAQFSGPCLKSPIPMRSCILELGKRRSWNRKAWHAQEEEGLQALHRLQIAGPEFCRMVG